MRWFVLTLLVLILLVGCAKTDKITGQTIQKPKIYIADADKVLERLNLLEDRLGNPRIELRVMDEEVVTDKRWVSAYPDDSARLVMVGDTKEKITRINLLIQVPLDNNKVVNANFLRMSELVAIVVENPKLTIEPEMQPPPMWVQGTVDKLNDIGGSIEEKRGDAIFKIVDSRDKDGTMSLIIRAA